MPYFCTCINLLVEIEETNSIVGGADTTAAVYVWWAQRHLSATAILAQVWVACYAGADLLGKLPMDTAALL